MLPPIGAIHTLRMRLCTLMLSVEPLPTVEPFSSIEREYVIIEIVRYIKESLNFTKFHHWITNKFITIYNEYLVFAKFSTHIL